MAYLPRELTRKIIEEEKLGILYDLQAGLEKEGKIPASPLLLLRKLQGVLEATGGFLLGGMVAAGTLLTNYVIFNFFLHIQF